MKRITNITRGFVQLSPNYNLFGDGRSSGVNTMDEANTEGVDYRGSINTVNKIFCVAILEKLMEY